MDRLALAAVVLAGLTAVAHAIGVDQPARVAALPDQRAIEESCAAIRAEATALGVKGVALDTGSPVRAETGTAYVPVSVAATAEPTALLRWLDRIASYPTVRADQGASEARLVAIKSLRLAATSETSVRAEAALRLYFATPGGALPSRDARSDRLAPLVLLAAKYERFTLGLVEAELTDSLRLRGFTVRPGPAERVKDTLQWAGYEVLELASQPVGSCERFELVARSSTTASPGGHEAAANLFVSADELCGSEGSLAPERLARVDGAVGDLTLRLRGMDAADVFRVLNETTGRGYVVQENVAARVSIEAPAASADAVEEALARELGITIMAGTVRHVGRSRAGGPWSPPIKDAEQPVTMSLPHAEIADLLRLFGDMTGYIMDAPAGLDGRVSVFVTETPIRAVVGSTLEAVGLRARPLLLDDGLARLALETVEEPGGGAAPGHPCALGYSRRTRALARTGDERYARCRCLPPAGVRAVELAGLVRVAGVWTAWIYAGPRATPCGPGSAFADGKVAAVDGEGITIETDDGHRLVMLLPELADH
jgi:hypothetical protein